MIDRAKFFPAVRPVFHGHLAQPQVDGMTFILDAWEKHQPAFDDLRWLAYMLGTAYHETAATMQPVHEYGGPAYFTRMYDITGARSAMAKRMGNVNPGDGTRYCGRGYVQITWHDTYAKIGRLIGEDLAGNPDLAMQPDIAARVMFAGMTAENPADTFSGVNLQRYFNADNEDWTGARRVINGTDHAVLIAGTAQAFYDAVDPQ